VDDHETWVEADVAGTLNASDLKGSDIRATTVIADPVSANEGRTYQPSDDSTKVSGAVSSKWAKGTGGPAGDEAYNLTVAPTVNGSQRQQVDGGMLDGHPAVAAVGIPRRLMPIECERLQGWPDGFTNVPKTTTVEGSDAAKTEYPSDSKRYRAIGNGVAKPVAQWIAWKIRLAAIEAYLTLTAALAPGAANARPDRADP
jgi:site-specific DNA-cytosine methylase